MNVSVAVSSGVESWITNILNDSSFPVIVLDDSGKIYSSNECWKEYTGQVSGSNERIQSLICQKFQEPFNQLIQSSQVELSKRHLIRINLPSAANITAYVRVAKIPNTSFTVALFHFLPDAEGSKKAPSSLFAHLSENLIEGIYRYAPGLGMIYVNKAMLALFNSQGEDLILYKNASDYFLDRYHFEQIVATIRTEMSVRNETVHFRRPDGSTFWGLLSCMVVNERGTVYYDGTIIDITEKKESEELLKAKNRELQKIQVQMDKFIYSASHDIRSPLTSIMGIANIMRMEAEPSLHIYLDKLDESLGRLDYFISEVMEFSENSRRTIDMERIHFRDLIDHAWRKVNGPYSRTSFEVELHGTENYFFYSDYQRLLIILTNIFKNSLYYSNPDQPDPYIQLEVNLHADSLILQIRDNGVGIGQEHLDRVFNMFYRAHDYACGSGMGLFIVKETVSRLGGLIKLDSTEAVGTTIQIELPNETKGKLLNRKVRMSIRQNGVQQSPA